MSSAATSAAAGGAAVPAGDTSPGGAGVGPQSSPTPTRQALPKTFAQQALAETFRRTGARVGLAWVAALAFCAVFAPFLANSHPILLKTDDHWTSPLVRNLTPTDVFLLIATAIVAYAVLFMRRHGFRARALVVLIVTVVATPLCFWLVRPPETVVYERYREAERAGKVQSILRTPVPYSPVDYLRDEAVQGEARQPPSKKHWMGRENYGADVLSRMIHACRIALSIGFIATGISVLVGITIGGLMGYFAGRVDMFGMRLIEIFEAIPQLVLLIICVAVFGRNLYLMMAIIGLTSWTTEARFIRAEFLRLRGQDFVQAAKAAGLPLRSIIFRHMLPNGVAPVLVAASFGVASAILYESTLSFLGLGLVQEPSWGQMLNQARSAGANFSWWIAVFPGMAIFLTVFAYNLIGEALRDALDPKLRQAH